MMDLQHCRQSLSDSSIFANSAARRLNSIYALSDLVSRGLSARTRAVCGSARNATARGIPSLKDRVRSVVDHRNLLTRVLQPYIFLYIGERKILFFVLSDMISERNSNHRRIGEKMLGLFMHVIIFCFQEMK